MHGLLMEGLTLTRRPALARARSLDADTAARLAFAVLVLGFAIGFFVYPTYPNYDSYYSLLWGQEVLHGITPTFEGFRVPTEHPLAIAAGALLSLFGDSGDRLWVAATLACFLWLIWGIYRLGRIAFTPLVGAIAAALLLTRFDYAFLAARGYIDIPYMALVMWAAVLEAERSRRGTPVFLLLAAAGMLRPEGWFLAGLYFLWMAWRATWGERIKYALLAAIGPAVWMGVDFAVTGDPLFSLLYTSGSAEDLGRSRSLSELPSTLPFFFSSLLKLPVVLAAGAGLVIALLATPRRMVMPFVLFAAGLGTFVAIAAAGASVIERYLTVAALALMIFAAVALGGFTMLRPGRLRTAWMAGSAALVVFGIVFTAVRVNLIEFDQELSFRGASHDALVEVLQAPAVREGLRCGPLSVPNHKLVPDARWVAGLPEGRVVARAESDRPDPQRGVALVVTSRFALFKHAWTDPNDSPLIQRPPEGFARATTSNYYTAYVRC
jgi:hypothetical protein